MYAELTIFSQWLRCKSPNASTHIHYANDLKLFFIWANKSPTDITVSDVDTYIAQSKAQGHTMATINRRLVALRVFYHFLGLHLDFPPANPVIPKRHFAKQGRRLPRDVSDSVLDQLFAVITSVRDKAIFTLMLRCGLRVGEIHRLSLADLDLQPSRSQHPRLWIWGKGGKQRVVYLSLHALASLKAWLAVRPNSSNQAVFLNHYGRRLTVAGIQHRLKIYCRQAGVRLTCHQLRHTFGRQLTEAQVPVTTTQRLLGHEQLRTTQLYTHLSMVTDIHP